MATALCRGFVQSGMTSAAHVCASDPYAVSREAFTARCGCDCVAGNQDVVSKSEILFLAVKPHQVVEVCREMKSSLEGRSLLVVSIAAGVTLSQLASALPEGTPIVRVMPNTPCLVGAGAMAMACGETVSQEQVRLLTELLSSVGLVVSVPEKQMDAVTGLSGSGPAYVFQMIEALSDGGVRVGLSRELSTKLAAQTLLGAAQMVLETGEHPGALKDAVTSPGGTTIAGLHALEQSGLRAALMNAVVAATKRSEELGKSSV